MTPKTAGYIDTTLCQTDRHTRAGPVTAGLVSGARVLTLRGEQPVQNLRIGEVLMTRDSGLVPVTGIRAVSIVTPVVYIIAGSIGHGCLHRDTLLSADQTILLRDWRAQALFGQDKALARAGTLVDREFVRHLGLQVVTLYELYCDTPQVFYADGLELGTPDCCETKSLRTAA